MQSTAHVQHWKGLMCHALNLHVKLPRYVMACVLLVIMGLQVRAIGNSQTVTIVVKDTPLQMVFKEITRQTGYQFLYSDQVLDRNKTVSVEVRNGSIMQVLDECLKLLPVSYTIERKTVVIKRRGRAIDEGTEMMTVGSVAVIDVNGKIVNKKGEPVEGASIIVKGTSKATTTNEKGEFSLKNIEENAVLVISGVNIVTQEIRVGGKNNLMVSVNTKISETEEVVISTGYQKISKERMVGSYAQLDSAAFHRRAGMGIIDRLDGTVTGVLFDKKSNGPIQIRGISTLDEINSPSRAPLIILDNFPYTGDIKNINPNDVENITILRDAAAASIWGTKAGNGVIVITTKKGQYNRSFQITARSNLTVQEKPDLYYYPTMSMGDFIEIEKMLFSKGFYNSTFTNARKPIVSPVVEILNKLRNGGISQEEATKQIEYLKQQDIRKDLDEYVNQKGLSQQYYINLSGGRENINYSISGGYNHSGPTIQGADYSQKQYTIASNTGLRLIKNLEVNVGINFSQSTVNNSTTAAGPYPYLQLVDSQGNHLAVPQNYRMSYIDTAGSGKLLDWKYRPLDEIGFADDKTINRLLLLGLNANYKFTKWLNAAVSYQYSNQTINNRRHFSPKTYFTRNLINLYTNLSQSDPLLRNPIPMGGIYEQLNQQSYAFNLRGQLNFNFNWGNDHALTALIAGERSQTDANNNSLRLYGYDDFTGVYSTQINYSTAYPIYDRLIGSTATISPSTGINEGLVSYFVSFLANASYTYKGGRYTIYGSARRDGSNVFGIKTNNKWKPLWSIGASWDVTKENFYRIAWLSSLRLSASYGYTGNVNNNITGVTTIQYNTALALYSSLKSARVNQPPNPDLRWEQVGMFNIGLDFGLKNNRVSGAIAYFHKKSEDLISAIPFSPATGVSTFYVNASSLKGSGFDLNLNTVNINKSVRWETKFGLSYAKMIVTKLYLANRTRAVDFVGYGSNNAVGKIAYGLASYRWAGLDPATGDPLGYLNGQISKNYTAISFDSVNHQIFHGSAIPLYSGFLNNSISWKNISLSANITYRLGFYFKKPSLNINYSNIVSAGNLGYVDYTSRWQRPGDQFVTNIPSIPYSASSTPIGRELFYANSELNILRGDNIRLQDIALSYNWTNINLKVLPIKSAQFFLYPNNLNIILWRNNTSNLDPDFVGGGVFLAPLPKTWTVGINITL